MAIAAGIISFADAKWNNLDAILGPAAQIESHEQIHQYLPMWRDVTETQKKRLKTWEEIYEYVLKETNGALTHS